MGATSPGNSWRDSEHQRHTRAPAAAAANRPACSGAATTLTRAVA